MVALRHDDGRFAGSATTTSRPSGLAVGRPPAGAGDESPGVGLRSGAGAALLVVLALWVGGSALTGEGAVSAGAEAPPAGSVYLVQPGESYWSIAVAIGASPGRDVRALVDTLEAANGQRPLRAGDRLVIPAGGR